MAIARVFKMICIVCDDGFGTLYRLKPHKAYACKRCVTAHMGVEPLAACVPELVRNFHKRREEEQIIKDFKRLQPSPER